MWINNELRDTVYENSLLHGFWENLRFTEDLTENLKGEFNEVKEEFRKGKKVTEVYETRGKPEGVPTELADIIIFILDYFGGSEPKIDVDETFLAEPDSWYKNDEYYKYAKSKTAEKHFWEISQLCLENGLDTFGINDLLNSFKDNEESKELSISEPLHLIIKLILTFADIWGIDMEQEVKAKMKYNATRPLKYRTVGTHKLLKTGIPEICYEFMERHLFLWPEDPKKIAETRERLIEAVMGKRKERKKLMERMGLEPEGNDAKGLEPEEDDGR